MYHAVIDFEGDKGGVFRPRADDVFKLSFRENDTFDHKKLVYWTFRVIEPMHWVKIMLLEGFNRSEKDLRSTPLHQENNWVVHQYVKTIFPKALS